MTGQELIDAAPLDAHGFAYIRFREEQWANPNAYARLSVHLTNGERLLGPWLHIFDRETQALIGEPTPQALLTPGNPIFGARQFRDGYFTPWTGALDPADT